LRERLQNENTLAKSQLEQLHLSDENLQEIELQDAVIEMHRYQKDLIVDLSRSGSVSSESARRLIQELDTYGH
jgi:DNA-directed RNA polymerase subunit H (RpoH/RPB5)